MPTRRPRAFVAHFVLIFLLSGCAAQTDDLPPIDQAALQTDFVNGDAMLSCNLGCAGNYGFHQRELKTLYDEGHWRDLSTEVLNIGENMDQAWFYLAAAAEGLGDDEAAQHYYLISLISRFQCSHGLNVCNGLDLPALTEQRLLDLDKKIQLSPDFAQLSAPPSPPGGPVEIHMLPSHGLSKVPVLVDGKIPLLFAVDSGSSGVTIPEGLAVLMIHQGLLKKSDFVGITRSILANGASTPVIIFHIASLQIGGLVLRNVVGGISPGPGELLLGQTFLNRFKSWSIDNSRQVLILQPS